MKQDIIMYGVCLALVIAAVAITSLIKYAVKAICEKCGKPLSSTMKEYIFTPLAVSLAGLGVYFWLRNGCEIQSESFIYLVSALAGTLTTIVYLAVFQPTRKIAAKIVQWISQKIDLRKAAQLLKEANANKDVDLGDIAGVVKTQKAMPNASLLAPQKPEDGESGQAVDKTSSAAPLTADERLAATLNAIKNIHKNK